MRNSVLEGFRHTIMMIHCVFKYLYAKSTNNAVSVGETMNFFVSQPKLAASNISKSVPVFHPTSVEVKRSVKTMH